MVMIFYANKEESFLFIEENKFNNIHYRKLYILLYNLIERCQKPKKGKHSGGPKKMQKHSK